MPPMSSLELYSLLFYSSINSADAINVFMAKKQIWQKPKDFWDESHGMKALDEYVLIVYIRELIF